jgi:hypothetical protein
MSHRDWTRRDLLKWGLGTVATTAALEGLGNILHVPGWHKLLGGSYLPNPHWSIKDSFEVTRQLGRMGTAAQLGALLQLQEAAAQSESDPWILITVKVFDQTHAPLVFALGEIDQAASLRDNNQVGQVRTAEDADATHFATRMASNATRQHLTAQGIKSLSRNPRMARLRFNEWFGSRLLNGTYDGAATKSNANVFGYNNYVGAFPEDVAIQVGLGVQPMDNIPVHQLFLGKMRKDLCDLAHFAALKGLVTSPLGITGFMMGENYDSNGSMLNNVVLSGLSAADNAKFDVSGRSLGQIVSNIDQSLNDGFGDYRDKNTSNLTYLFDKLSISNPQRRSALLDNRQKVKNSISQMTALGNLEKTTHIASPAANIANRQAFFEGGTYVERAAQQEFMAQCAFVAETLKIDVLPYRNFSLFLNLNDLDGSNIDNPTNGSTSFRANSLNYVEGMRQLAMGLNMLARAISGKNALIVVVTDGGRSRNMGDGSGPGIAMLMGPKKSGYLDDEVHGPMDRINSLEREFLDDLGNRSTGLPWTTGGNDWGLCDNFGRRLTGMQVNMGDWQVGALQFMAEKQRRNVVAPELGRYVRFKRRA